MTEPHDQKDSTGEKFVPLQLRRSPRYMPFIAIGMILGVIVAGAFVLVPQEPPYLGNEYSRTSVLWLLIVAFGIGGALVGAGIALILDAVSIRRSTVVQAQIYETDQQAPKTD